MAKSGNRRYNLDKSACGKRGDAENAGTIRARVRAESEESGNRRHNPSEYTCGKRRRAETAGTIRARVPAERGEERRPQVQSGQEYLRKEEKSGNRMYNPGKSTCGKRGDAETAGTIRARVPAERGEERKPHVQSGQEYVRKTRRCRSVLTWNGFVLPSNALQWKRPFRWSAPERQW